MIFLPIQSLPQNPSYKGVPELVEIPSPRANTDSPSLLSLLARQGSPTTMIENRQFGTFSPLPLLTQLGDMIDSIDREIKATKERLGGRHTRSSKSSIVCKRTSSAKVARIKEKAHRLRFRENRCPLAPPPLLPRLKSGEKVAISLAMRN